MCDADGWINDSADSALAYSQSDRNDPCTGHGDDRQLGQRLTLPLPVEDWRVPTTWHRNFRVMLARHRLWLAKLRARRTILHGHDLRRGFCQLQVPRQNTR